MRRVRRRHDVQVVRQFDDLVELLCPVFTVVEGGWSIKAYDVVAEVTIVLIRSDDCPKLTCQV
jgi:hypothetical protein